MSNTKPKLFIIEGGQGSGKSSIARLLREKMTSTQLLSMSGNKDLSNTGSVRSLCQHMATYSYLYDIKSCQLDMILERSHLSETVFANLGYKPYSFEKETEILNNQLNMLTVCYDVYIFILTCDEKEFEKRLVRDKGSYVGFCVDGSMKQQDSYLLELKKIEETYPNINCYVVDTNNYNAEEIADFIVKTVE